ncbi:MAG: FAD/NAD(P)-binding protein [Spirochaetales bacterium]|nr:FAD/NAD(P)-binding protein [Spirochaetales bacterium]
MGNCQCQSNTKGSSIYLPEIARITRKKLMTDVDCFFEFEMEKRPLGHKYGQFVEISIPGIGEAPISISSAPSSSKKFEMVIRNVGELTSVIHGLNIGEAIGVRGPYGTTFPMDDLKGKSLLYITGGIGLVPARSAILHSLANRNDYKDITILFGCKDPSQRIFVDELSEWEKRPDVNFLETVDTAANSNWKGNVGVITTLMPKLQNVNPDNTVAIVVGPPIMYKFVIMSLHDMGFTDDHIVVSLERRMKCGVGKCGHCQINHIYVCQDGPVFYFSDIKDLKEAI